MPLPLPPKPLSMSMGSATSRAFSMLRLFVYALSAGPASNFSQRMRARVCSNAAPRSMALQSADANAFASSSRHQPSSSSGSVVLSSASWSPAVRPYSSGHRSRAASVSACSSGSSVAASTPRVAPSASMAISGHHWRCLGIFVAGSRATPDAPICMASRWHPLPPNARRPMMAALSASHCVLEVA